MMTLSSRVIFSSALAVTTCIASVAMAGEKTPLSKLPMMGPAPQMLDKPRPKPAGLELVSKTASGNPELTITPSKGYCIALGDGSLRKQLSPPNSGELWRFTEQKGEKDASKATLERMSFDVSTGATEANRTSSIVRTDLSIVAKSAHVTVYSFRGANGDIMLIARHAQQGRETTQDSTDSVRPFVFSECEFGAVQLSTAKAKGGTVAQLMGQVPKNDKTQTPEIHFTIDASLAKVGRDPEPILSVRIRESAQSARSE